MLIFSCGESSEVYFEIFFRRLQAELAREMAYTAARFGHVMFPENVYEPALKCAELLIDGVGKGFFSHIVSIIFFKH